MKIANVIILCAWMALSGVFVWRVIFQLVSGKLTERGGTATASRRENAALYWRGMIVEVVMAAAMVDLLIMAAGSLVH